MYPIPLPKIKSDPDGLNSKLIGPGLDFKKPQYKQSINQQEKSYFDNIIDNMLDMGYDIDWKTGSIQLRATKIRINLGPNQKFRDYGDHSLAFEISLDYIFNSQEDKMGECHSTFNWVEKTMKTNIYRKRNLSYKEGKYVGGHEEGHAMVQTGNMTALWNTAQELGIYFSHFYKSEALHSDELVRKCLNGTGSREELKIAWEKGYALGESIADVGGLIALIKINAEHNLISHLKTRIQKNFISVQNNGKYINPINKLVI